MRGLMGRRVGGGIASAVLAVAVGIATGCAVGDSSGAGSLTFGGSNPTNDSSPSGDGSSGADSAGVSASASSNDDTNGDANDDTHSESVSDTQATTPEGSTTDVAPGECGDGIAQADEGCDADDFGVQSCADFGFEDGALLCDSSCNVITEGCRTCGDGVVGPSELCDGDDLAGETCQSQGFGGGALLCDATCTGYDETVCTPLPTCGDGTVNGTEQCDGGALGGATCVSLGFDAGSLSCNPASCTHNTSQCEFLNCGGSGEFCLFDPDDPQGTCCAAGVAGNVLGICVLAICQ